MTRMDDPRVRRILKQALGEPDKEAIRRLVQPTVREAYEDHLAAEAEREARDTAFRAEQKRLEAAAEAGRQAALDAVTTPKPPAPTTEKISMGKRKGTRDSVIAEAEDAAARRGHDRHDTSAVWNELVSAVRGSSPPYPFIKEAEGELFFEYGGELKAYTRKMLGQKLARDRARTAKDR